MKFVVDANVLISALITDAKTRELLLELDQDFFTPQVIHDEIDRHRDLIVEKSSLDPDQVDRLLSTLFKYIAVVPEESFITSLEEAEDAIGDIDEDDVLYLATALALDTAIWSDDADFQEQDLVGVYTTSEMVTEFDRGS